MSLTFRVSTVLEGVLKHQGGRGGHYESRERSWQGLRSFGTTNPSLSTLSVNLESGPDRLTCHVSDPGTRGCSRQSRGSYGGSRTVRGCQGSTGFTGDRVLWDPTVQTFSSVGREGSTTIDDGLHPHTSRAPEKWEGRG